MLGALVAMLVAAGAAMAGNRGTVQVHTGAAPGDPVRMPSGDIPGWREVFSDGFSGNRLDRAKWLSYSGQPGGDPAGWFAPRHVTVSHGMLTISAYRDPRRHERWTTGGVSSSPGLVQTYGKYLVRFRMDAGVGVSYVLLLWPHDNSWPPEIDFSEDDGSQGDGDVATLHYGADDRTVARSVHVNLTGWHTLGVQWLTGSLTFTLDGHRWADITGAEVPAIPMVLDMQTQTWPCSRTSWERCPGTYTPSRMRLEVDWVVAYAPDRSARRDG